MSQEIREIWTRFDDLIGKAGNDDTKLIIEAIKLQAELINRRLGPLAPEIAVAVQRAIQKL